MMSEGKRILRFALGFLLAVGLSACGWAEFPARPGVQDVSSGRVSSTAPARVPAARSDPVFVGANAVIVGKGDTVYAISRRHQVSPRAIIEVNSLTPPYRLYPGQRLVLPHARKHVVRRGDTVYGISRRYGVSMYELSRINGLRPPYTILVGQELTLPAGIPAPQPAAARAVAKKVAQEKKAVAQKREAPKPPPAAKTASKPTSKPASKPASKPPSKPKATQKSGTAVTLAKPPSKPAPAKAVKPVAKPPSRTNSGFLWPASGKVISKFGPKSKGLHNDGINISAPRGTAVKASENGVVAYAGNEIRGFGNLLLIKHTGGWISAYAHNDQLLVKRGDKIKRGQTIAKMGSSGNVSSTQLHFELRKGRRAVDPLKYLKS